MNLFSINDIHEVRVFLGFCGYYRRFIRNYDQISTPLYNLLKKDITFNWTSIEEKSFQDLKFVLMSLYESRQNTRYPSDLRP